MPSTGVSIAIGLVVGIIIGVAGGYFIGQSMSSSPQTTPSTGIKIYILGGLFPLSGTLQSTGQKTMKPAALLAINDINNWLQSINSNIRFNITIVDTKTDPQTALQDLQSLASQGIHVFIGPASSSEVGALKTYANQSHLVVISPSSTSPTVVPHPYVFRVVGTDANQGAALAYLVKSQGFSKAVMVYRNDPYGSAFAGVFSSVAQSLGIQVVNVSYDPNLTPSGAPTVESTISSDVSQMGGPSQVAIAVVAFDEGQYIIANALSDPNVNNARWFFGEGFLDKAVDLINQSKYGSQYLNFFVNTKTEITTPAAVSLTSKAFAQEFQAKYGYLPDTYAYYTYDAVWMAALSILAAGTDNGVAVAKAFPVIASTYYGVSGFKYLDSNGDAKYQDYQILALNNVNGQYQWTTVGLYNSQSRTISPYSG
jgi:branched-chain amino acid transport system substrate-binding protein